MRVPRQRACLRRLSIRIERAGTIAWARKIAFSGKRLQIWWSTEDEIVVDQAAQSAALFNRIKQLNPRASVTKVVALVLQDTSDVELPCEASSVAPL